MEVKFGTGGFRGIIGDNFTKENVQKICQSIANISKHKNYKKKICIGYDNRFMSENFALWCAEVFAGNDFTVELFKNACATPVVMYQTMIEDNDYGIMITASHNPYVYNGVKVFTKQGRDASLDDTNLIEEEFKKVEEVFVVNNEQRKRIVYVDYVNDFVDYLVKNQEIPNCSNLKVVFDTKFGSTAEEIKLLCSKLNLKNYKIINENRDAFFNFITPAPSMDNVEELKQNVILSGADIGFALDADGDRLAVVDRFGNFLDNNIILSLVYYFLVKCQNKQGDVVKNVATTSLLDLLAEKFGYVCHEVQVGFKYISSTLIDTNAVVGGESSGGLALQNHIYGKDSLVSIAICLKILEFYKKPFDEIVDEMLKFANNFNKKIRDKQYTYSTEKETSIKTMLFRDGSLPKLNHKAKKIVVKDYVKIFYENDDWVLIRFSGTEPILRIFAEFETERDCFDEFLLWETFLKL